REQQRRERDAAALPAGHLADAAVEREVADAEAVEHLVAAGVETPQLRRLGPLEQRRVALRHVRVVARERLPRRLELTLEATQCAELRLEDRGERGIRVGAHLLAQQGGGVGTLDAPRIRLELAREDAE